MKKETLAQVFSCEFFEISKNDFSTEHLGRRRSDVFIVNFEHISHLFLVFLLLTLSSYMPAGKLPATLSNI